MIIVESVPEPASAAFLGFATGAFLLNRRRR
ncbi:MAG: PEP-CTERM sorting domain-containing protein [Verrucomicrobiaceae bacterium]|nr:MAG: PEP-CTERM sorting domain-containing protein [Verrucomicrobiaceae bacterium]